MTVIKVDCNERIGEIKAMHGVGQPPLDGISTQYFHYLKDANIPYSRLHDVGGWFGGNMWVDIPNIFRDFDKDESNPDNYDFTWTDILLKGLIDNGCQPYFRLGVTIENFHKIKYYRIAPPKDMTKWARICEHIIRHYNEGWANGFFYNIQYWEIWNEPDNSYSIDESEMWKGTKEEYFDLYRITSTHLRKCFGDSIKIGGYASCGFYAIAENTDKKVGAMAMGMQGELNGWETRTMGFVNFFLDFVKMVKEENLPWDFFAYHSYGDVETNLKMEKYVEKVFTENGLTNIEIHLNEWNTNPSKQERGTLKACANAVSMMCAMQNTQMEIMCYYDAQIGVSVYGGLFNPLTCEPFPTYYGFKAFGEIYKLGTQVKCCCDNKDIYIVSACREGKGLLLVVNNKDTVQDVTVEGIQTKGYVMVGKNKNLEFDKSTNNDFTLNPFETLLITY